MAFYDIRLQPSVEKDVRRIAKSDLRRIFERIEALYLPILSLATLSS
jgi:hypothetical protein